MEGVYHKRTEAVHPQPQTESGREENCTIPSLPDLKSIQYLLSGLVVYFLIVCSAHTLVLLLIYFLYRCHFRYVCV